MLAAWQKVNYLNYDTKITLGADINENESHYLWHLLYFSSSPNSRDTNNRKCGIDLLLVNITG